MKIRLFSLMLSLVFIFQFPVVISEAEIIEEEIKEEQVVVYISTEESSTSSVEEEDIPEPPKQEKKTVLSKDDILNLIDNLCIELGYDNPALIKAIVKCESNFNTRSLGSCGERGLMQITPKWFKGYLEQLEITADELYIPEYNLRIGIMYFSSLCEKYSSESRALVVYNCGVAGSKGKTSTSYSQKVLRAVGEFI